MCSTPLPVYLKKTEKLKYLSSWELIINLLKNIPQFPFTIRFKKKKKNAHSSGWYSRLPTTNYNLLPLLHSYPALSLQSTMLHVTLLTISQTAMTHSEDSLCLDGPSYLSSLPEKLLLIIQDTPQMPCPLSSFLESPDTTNGTIHFLTIINGASMLIFEIQRWTRDYHSPVRTEVVSDKLLYIIYTSTKKLHHWAGRTQERMAW